MVKRKKIQIKVAIPKSGLALSPDHSQLFHFLSSQELMTQIISPSKTLILLATSSGPHVTLKRKLGIGLGKMLNITLLQHRLIRLYDEGYSL